MKLKRLAHPLSKEKKKSTYTVRPRGPHPLEKSIALATLLRDYLGIADGYREAKKIVKQGKILVDGRVIKDYKFGVGPFDVIEIPDMKKYYRVLPKGEKLSIVEIDEKEAKVKICKINDKKAVKGGKFQLNLHDGKNVVVEDNSYKTQGSLLIELPDQKIVEYVPLEENVIGYIYSGKNAGIYGKIEKIERGWRRNRVLIKTDDGEVWTTFKNIIVVGRSKPLIKVV